MRACACTTYLFSASSRCREPTIGGRALASQGVDEAWIAICVGHPHTEHSVGIDGQRHYQRRRSGHPGAHTDFCGLGMPLPMHETPFASEFRTGCPSMAYLSLWSLASSGLIQSDVGPARPDEAALKAYKAGDRAFLCFTVLVK